MPDSGQISTVSHYSERNMPERKSIDWLMTIQTTLVGVATVILGAGVPWAYVVGNKIAVIESSMSAANETVKELKSANTTSIREHEHRITEVEMDVRLLKQYADQMKARQAKQQ